MRWLALGCAVVLLAGCGAWGEPSPSGPVVDSADILSSQDEAKLDKELREYFDRTGNALVVTSVVSLDGVPIEEVSRNLANKWGVGDARTMRGLMITVAPNERKVRIDVACGLESVITDERAQAIIDDAMIPRFRAGEMSGATIAGAEALMQATETYRSDLGKSLHSPGCLKEAA